ncbi:hypothetical protein CPAST_c25970 [Clostridium pasteurianum DSM 525 = ATCC 6013]|uniref:Uncharacterized protein n=1 Tax=Clostridium pasteurianum DSM 525 = ATCC 6013 TaxID=1262449 RepID=A0A0H3J412_CLOPA|nr:hypothetical protein [Clostridium pasteurianum]AJA48666.1 hypothetical protein CPAST_c25970 [Clostridium pasteurianum DSM 525 = ATCC 6013]AJA52654.1 hypothetical protein CLPA_c25970 [Clostridium pasteurianum DSM 525 = ATCC 6013]AOZ75894.1 hypothetical protein AQ983_12625 [Clostridium pasteurianum DSM 525 = ATCC 6013]AOZ79690.1 hypothetical protein AQ984_12620 [Clostridium pasteurianum]ELP59966.1 hypothetical protein F502_05002 [Clostridium pasteurianum DSM 525 = ATCC 6013]
MSEYKFLDQFYKDALIDPKQIVFKEVNVSDLFVTIYIVAKNKNMFDIFTAVGDIDKPIKNESINHVLVFENQLKKLCKQIE